MIQPEMNSPDRAAIGDLYKVSPVFGDSTFPRQGDRSAFLSLYEAGKREQWNASTDIQWNSCDRNTELGEDSHFALGFFDQSGLAKYGRETWNRFRREFQDWMVSQFLPGEQAALVAAARVLDVIPNSQARYCLAGQVVDEARHIEVFSRYTKQHVGTPYPMSASLAKLLRESLVDARWDVTVLGMHVMVEALAMAALRLADKTFHDELLRSICRLVARDEVRHVSLGVLSLKSVYGELTEAELQERRDFALEGIDLISRRFLLEEIWERIGVSRSDGIVFAKSNEIMIMYRQVVCSRIVSSMANIGLFNSQLKERLIHLNLMSPASVRLMRTHAVE